LNKIIPGDVYHHFKGRDYKVLCLATNTENEELMVVYEALYDEHKIWVRPYDMFTDLVDIKKYPNTKQKYRFELKNKIEGGNKNG